MSVSAKSTKIQSFNKLPLYVHKQSDFNDPVSISSHKQYTYTINVMQYNTYIYLHYYIRWTVKI